jgi:pimeloyl-ACP methyl ester carboxylesterase
MRPVFADAPCPALVIHGEADAVVSPATGQAAARLFACGTHLAYEGVGHAPFLEAPDRFAADLAAFATACR